MMKRKPLYKTELCLCTRCAQQIYGSSQQKIVRADPVQVVMDMCDCCRTRRGYDFILTGPIRTRRPGYKAAACQLAGKVFSGLNA